MNALEMFAGLDWWTVAGWTMLHYLWLGLVVGAVAAVLRFVLRRASANVRYVAALVCLVALVVLPVGVGIGVGSREPGARKASGERVVDASTKPQAVVVAGRVEARGQGVGVVGSAKPQAVGEAVEKEIAPETANNVAIVPVDVAPIVARPLAEWSAAVDVVARWLPWVWIVGAPVTFLLLATGVVGAERLRRESRLVLDGPIVECLERLRSTLAIGRRVAVAVCDRVAAPVLVGVVRPLVLLPPAALSGWSPDEIEMVLLHELAHVRRWDNLVNLVQRFVEAALFFQPAVWLVSGWVRREREACCDAVVVGRTQRPQAYAELLVEMAALMCQPSEPGRPRPRFGTFTRGRARPGSQGSLVSAMAAGPLRGRIRRILGIHDDPMLISGKSLGVVMCGLLLAATLAVLNLPTSGTAKETATKTAFAADRLFEALEKYRRVVVGYDLDFDSVFPDRPWTTYEAERLKRYPTPQAWPNVLGHVDTDADEFQQISEAPDGKFQTVTGGAVFVQPLAWSVSGQDYTTLLFLEGIETDAHVVAPSYTSFASYGTMAGDVLFKSYATALVDGDLSGQITADSYFNLVVTGTFTGQINAGSYAMVYLMGGLGGEMELERSKVYIVGRTEKAALGRIRGRGKVYLEESDLGAGEHQIGELAVTVKSGGGHSATYRTIEDTAGTKGTEKQMAVPFVVGTMRFAEGDRITITEVMGTSKTFEPGGTYWIEGRYTLASRERASLSAFVTAKSAGDGKTSIDKEQTTTVERGSGKFSLKLRMPYEGWPHVSFYPAEGGEGFGGVYFGTGYSVLSQWWDEQQRSSDASARATRDTASENALRLREIVHLRKAKKELEAKLDEVQQDFLAIKNQLRATESDDEDKTTSLLRKEHQIRLGVLQQELKNVNESLKRATARRKAEQETGLTTESNEDAKRTFVDKVDVPNTAALFVVSSDNPEETRSYALLSKERDALLVNLESLRNGRLGVDMPFTYKASETQRNGVDVVAAKAAQEKFFAGYVRLFDEGLIASVTVDGAKPGKTGIAGALTPEVTERDSLSDGGTLTSQAIHAKFVPGDGNALETKHYVVADPQRTRAKLDAISAVLSADTSQPRAEYRGVWSDEGTRFKFVAPRAGQQLVKATIDELNNDKWRSETTNHLKDLMLAVLNYDAATEHLPPRAKFDASGKPLLSWRVLILPYLDPEYAKLYEEFHLDEPWDSEHNRQLVARIPEVFRNPQIDRPGMTNYLAVVGEECVFSPDGKPIAMRQISDGTANTIAIVEANADRAVEWTKPEDWEFDREHPTGGLGKLWRNGWTAVWVDGHIRWVSNEEPAEEVGIQFTRAGGETKLLSESAGSVGGNMIAGMDDGNRYGAPGEMMSGETGRSGNPALDVAANKFPTLEEQKLADVVYRRLGLELEPLSADDIRRVRALGFEGGMKVSLNDGSVISWERNRAGILPNDILVGLHVWPTKSAADVVAVLERDDLAELNPLKYYAVRPGQSGGGGFGNGTPEADTVGTGRINVRVNKTAADSTRRSEINRSPRVVEATPQLTPSATLKSASDASSVDQQVERALADDPTMQMMLLEIMALQNQLNAERSNAKAGGSDEIDRLKASIKEELERIVDYRKSVRENLNAELRYDGKTFDQWRREWQTELSTEKRIEAVQALAAFGRAGYGKEAAAVILDVAGEYDFTFLQQDDDPDGKFKQTVVEVLAPESGRPSMAEFWLPDLVGRMKDNPGKWQPLVELTLWQLASDRPEVIGNLRNLANDEPNEVRSAALVALVRSDRVAKRTVQVSEETRKLLGAALASGDADRIRFALPLLLYDATNHWATMGHGMANPQLLYLPEIVGPLVGADEGVRQQARLQLQHLQAKDAPALLEQLLTVLKDESRAAEQVEAIRAIAAIGPAAIGATPALRQIVLEGKNEDAVIAALFANTCINDDKFSAHLVQGTLGSGDLAPTCYNTAVNAFHLQDAAAAEFHSKAEGIERFSPRLKREAEVIFPESRPRQGGGMF